jgi:hypothetical protein
VRRNAEELHADQSYWYAQLGVMILAHDHVEDNRKEEERRRAYSMRPPQLSGDACSGCGNFSMQRAGTCLLCIVCGTTTGCS